MNDMNLPQVMSQLNQSQAMSQPHVMNQPPQPQVMNQPQVMSQPQIMPQSQSQMMSQSQAMNQSQMMNQPQVLNQPQMMNQPPQMLNRSYGMWPPQPGMDALAFPNPIKPGFAASKPGRSNWKGKKAANKQKDMRRMEKTGVNPTMSGVTGGSGGGGGGYRPPTLHELQSQNRLKARKFYPKKKFNNRFAPFAPRNTTSFIIRAKKSGGIASLVSPCPVTPAVLPTPIFSPSREVLVDMAKEEWGVDGYGSMKGLIRLRSPGHEADGHEDDEDEEGGGSSESDVEEHVEVERRLDHDLSRFEMIYPNCGVEYNNILENRVDDQDTHIAQLEEENLTLKERLFLMERELGDLRRRLQCLERQNQVLEDINEEVVENGSENDSDGRGDFNATAENNEEVAEFVPENGGGVGVDVKENNDGASDNERIGDACKEDFTQAPEKLIAEDESKDRGAGNGCSEKNISDRD
ncbi:uncharacterized protein LOC131149289 [Malania oleifera]|uniref:uncharacterized protein LOC131149289 n=1 Tax=Malania oleifera TaxID=397392 RepID=UPI0025AE7411|nr:uncharacterized protein LOC131149289 [Malania oleifera]